MDAARYRPFFLRPRAPAHRQYEALRAVVVEGQPMQQVARRLGYRYDTVRALVCRFRQHCDAGQPPPFSPRRRAADRRVLRRARPAPAPRPAPRRTRAA